MQLNGCERSIAPDSACPASDPDRVSRYCSRHADDCGRALCCCGNGCRGSGRGSWIRTNDLQYPKLPRYQAALYPDVRKGQLSRKATSLHGRALRSKAVDGPSRETKALNETAPGSAPEAME